MDRPFQPAAPAPVWKEPAFILAASLFLLRVLYAPWCELFPEEAYYWNYAQHLDIGYLDHPPMVAWLIALGTAVFGHSEWAVRVGSLGCSLVTSFFAFRLTETLYRDRRAALLAVALVQTLPYYFLAGWVMTPDAPLAACWAGTLYFLARVLIDGDGRAWFGVGTFLGLGLLSKYTIVLLGPATLLFLALNPASRHWFRRVAPYAGTAWALAIFSPVVVWNARHHWASFAFQSTGRIEAASRFSLHYLFLSLFAVLTPLGMYLAGRILVGRAGEGEEENRRRVLFARVYTLVPFAVFVLFSLTHRVKLNWTGPLWLAALPGVASLVVATPASWVRVCWRATVAILCVGAVVFVQYLAVGLPGVHYFRQIELLPVGWRELSRELTAQQHAIQQAHADKPVLLVGMDRDFITSEMAFYTPDGTRASQEITGPHLFDSESLMYAYWFPAQRAEGNTLLLAAFEQKDLDSARVLKHSATAGPVEEHPLQANGKPVRTYYTRVVTGYHSERSPKK